MALNVKNQQPQQPGYNVCRGRRAGLERFEIAHVRYTRGRSFCEPSVSAPAPEVGGLRTACRRLMFRVATCTAPSSGRISRASQQSLRLLVKVFSRVCLHEPKATPPLSCCSQVDPLFCSRCETLEASASTAAVTVQRGRR